ncbi:hypothetical protein ACIGHG_05735 [Bacillus sp. NPDC077411]
MALMDTIPHFNTGQYQGYVDIKLVILVATGVISNPDAGKRFVEKVLKKNKNAV